MIRAGELRHPVQIQSNEGALDAVGQVDESDDAAGWETFASTRARFRTLKGRERWAAQQIHAKIFGEFMTRYIAGVTAKMRIKMTVSGRIFNILYIDNVDEMSRELLIYVEEIVGV